VGKLLLPNNQKVFISDTVGFINKLPHQLIAAFKATFEEVKESDFLVHVIDISTIHCEAQVMAVNSVLEEIGIPPKKTIHVLNKIDLVSQKKTIATWLKKLDNSVAFSALTGEGIDDLLSMIEHLASSSLQRVKLKIPFTSGKIMGQVLQQGKIIRRKYLTTGIVIEAELDKAMVDSLKPYLK
jgi:GTP-binding protein HflX